MFKYKWEENRNLIFLLMLCLKPKEEELPLYSSWRIFPMFFFKTICIQSVQVKEHHSLMNCFG